MKGRMLKSLQDTQEAETGEALEPKSFPHLKEKQIQKQPAQLWWHVDTACNRKREQGR